MDRGPKNKQGRKKRSDTGGLLLLLAAAAASGQTVSAGSRVVSALPPPMYRSFSARAGEAHSMVYGPGTLEGGTIPRPAPAPAPLTLAPHCAQPPTAGELRSASALQTATASQAKALGLVLRSASGEAQPFLPGRVVLWRAGRYAECQAPSGQTLVYGAEWIVGFLLKSGQEPPPATLPALDRSLRHGELEELGWQINGGAQADELQHGLQDLAGSFSLGHDLSSRLEALIAAWPASRLATGAVPSESATALGVAAPPGTEPRR